MNVITVNDLFACVYFSILFRSAFYTYTDIDGFRIHMYVICMRIHAYIRFQLLVRAVPVDYLPAHAGALHAGKATLGVARKLCVCLDGLLAATVRSWISPAR